VWVADPGRAYVPSDGLVAFATMLVPTTLELEDHTERRVILYRLEASKARRGLCPSTPLKA
jgi:predicted nicotinamide N-methyase